ncbi:MAG: ROK family protein [Planctomycetota bacterium]|nr:ROK family protein [Planctomycetota bacterium]
MAQIGIDLGGTKIEGVLLDAAGAVLARRRVPTPAGYEAIVAAVADLVGLLQVEATRPATVGVGIPGTVDAHSGRVKNANTTSLIGQPLRADLVARLGQDVRIANDANCFAVAEARAGAAQGHKLVFGIILGTGVGGGLVVDGVARTGPHGIAGEWGHSPLDDRDPEAPAAPPCYCGQRGCVETRLSGPAFERDYERLAGTARGAAEILSRVETGDRAARRALDRYLAFYGEGVARLLHILDPDAIVLGGGMSNNPYLPTLGRAAVEAVLFNARLDTPILRHALGDSAGVFGAAWLWSERVE